MVTASLVDLKSRHFYTALLAEMFGTLLLVLIGAGSCVDPGKFDLTRTALCFGFTVATIVWAIGNVSGGHINPAVTVGFLVTRRISLIRALLYIVAQVIGAILGAVILDAITPSTIKNNLCTPGVGAGYSSGQAFGIELIVTFLLVFVVFSSVDSQRGDIGGSVPLTIGLVIATCHFSAIPKTGSSQNPARAFGPALISSTWDNHWVYWIGPLIGGVLAGLLYDLVFAVNASPAKLKGFFTLSYNNDNYDKEGRLDAPNKNAVGNSTEMQGDI